MKPAESSIIHLLRSITLLATLTLVPGIALFWNWLPEGGLLKNSESNHAPLPGVRAEETILPSPEIEPAISQSAPLVATEYLASEYPVSEYPIRQVSWDDTPPRPMPPQNFTMLEERLKALGVAEYQLTKWGNRGELFRFSCYVTPPGPYAYKKHFEAIGGDAMTVMQSVIADIERWQPPHRR